MLHASKDLNNDDPNTILISGEKLLIKTIV